MTVKLFADDSLKKECPATVLSCTEKDGKFLIELDQTVFFPEGGGQLSDRGRIDSSYIDYVFEREGHIYHRGDKYIPAGSTAQAVLDWPLRLDRMQQHLGEHLLSYACWKLFAANNAGFHMSENSVTIDLDKDLSYEELSQAELLANQLIWDNRPVRISYLDSREAARQDNMRKFNKSLQGILRIISVDGADKCTCCGTHPPYTGMLGSIKVLRREKHKGGCRVEFACGQRALSAACSNTAAIRELAEALSVKPEQTAPAVMKNLREAKERLDLAHTKIIALYAYKLELLHRQAPMRSSGIKIVAVPMPDCDPKELKQLLSHLNSWERTIFLLAAASPQRISYAAAAGSNTPDDCRLLLKYLNQAFDGRGGGEQACAQGGSEYHSDWQQRLQKAARQILAIR